MANYSANDIANWFLSKEEASPKKLQKLVYYAYSWFITLNNDEGTAISNKLFDDNIEAWVHGPVIPSLYYRFKKYGYRSIPKEEAENYPEFDDAVLEVLNSVQSVYGSFTANELESITHQEDPWKKSREGYGPLDNCNEVISDKVIFDYYSQRIA